MAVVQGPQSTVPANEINTSRSTSAAPATKSAPQGQSSAPATSCHQICPSRSTNYGALRGICALQGPQSAAHATKSTQGPQSAAPTTKCAIQGPQSTAPATKSAHQDSHGAALLRRFAARARCQKRSFHSRLLLTFQKSRLTAPASTPKTTTMSRPKHRGCH